MPKKGGVAANHNTDTGHSGAATATGGAAKKMLAVQRAHRARSNYSEEKKEELRRINRDRARQRRALMTEEEKHLVRLRQRLNTRKKRETERQRQKELREEGYPSQSQTNFSKPSHETIGGMNHSAAGSSSASSTSSLVPGGQLSIPHPHSQGFSQSRLQHPHNQSMSMTGQWNGNNLNAIMSPSHISYQRSGQIHQDSNNLLLSPQSGYPQQQRYDGIGNDFNDRAQMQNQMKMSMNILEDCVRRLTAVEKEVVEWKSKFETEAEKRSILEDWVLEKFGIDLRTRFARMQSPKKPKAANSRAKKRKKPTPANERFSLNQEPPAKIPSLPPSATAVSTESMWDADALHTALNLEGIAYNALSIANNIPPFNVIKEETVVDLYSSTINPSSSIISYK